MEFINYMRDVFSSDYAREGKKLNEAPLEYEEDYHLAYIDWLMGDLPEQLVEEVYLAQLNSQKPVAERDPCITFLTVPTINGFTMHFEAYRWSQDDLRYFFEYMASTLTEHLGYEQVDAVREEVQYKDRHEVVERYKLAALSEDMDYSDIMLRLCYTDGAISSLKFCAVRTRRRIANFPALLRRLLAA